MICKALPTLLRMSARRRKHENMVYRILETILAMFSFKVARVCDGSVGRIDLLKVMKG